MKHTLPIIAGKLGIVLLAAIFFSSCKKESKDPAITQTKTPPIESKPTPVYQLIWSDEFDGNGVDASKWKFETGNLNVNNEREYYQADNATVSNGNLVITAKKQTVAGQPYTSARLNTLSLFDCTYGRIEARVKLPLGKGLWPAFWMLGSDINTVGWPKCGEIDIMEHVNADNLIYGTIHWDNNGHAQYGNSTASTPEDYHIYAVEWDSSSIRWYVDDKLYNTANIQYNINGTDEFHLPFFIILNLAVGGDWPGQTIDETQLPANMYVDYVKVYKQIN